MAAMAGDSVWSGRRSAPVDLKDESKKVKFPMGGSKK